MLGLFLDLMKITVVIESLSITKPNVLQREVFNCIKVDRVLAQCREFVSDVKQYHEEKFVSFRGGEDRLDHFLYEGLIENLKICGHFSNSC